MVVSLALDHRIKTRGIGTQPKSWGFDFSFCCFFFFFCSLYSMVVAKYLFVGRVTLTELMKTECC